VAVDIGSQPKAQTVLQGVLAVAVVLRLAVAQVVVAQGLLVKALLVVLVL
jgi:hypothetical protein